jgi:hypothetical protein
VSVPDRLEELQGNPEERLHHRRIEVRARRALDLDARRLEGYGHRIRPVAGHGIEGVGHREDARAEGNELALRADG